MMSNPSESPVSFGRRLLVGPRAAHSGARPALGVVLAAALAAALAAGGCTPTVKVATEDPITINLNVNIKHEILVKVDKELDDLFGEDSDLF